MFEPDYFSLLALPEQYSVDGDALKTAYFRVARLCHPDLFMQKPVTEQLAAAQKMATLNQAFATLADAFLRAKYLASRRYPKGLSNITLPLAYLEEQMALREEIAEGEQAADATEKKVALKVKVQNELKHLEQQCAHIFDVSPNSEQLSLILQRWPYYQRALAQLSV